jgi:hypothetical protein
VLAAMVMVPVHVTDVITIKALAAVTIILEQSARHQEHNIRSVLAEYFLVTALNVWDARAVLVMLTAPD